MSAGNPNLLLWMPKGETPTKENTNIQDVPNPIEDMEDIIIQKAEEAEYNKTKELHGKLQRDNTKDEILVSVDDPRKYPIVKDFIRRKGLKVYGGIAINSYLGKDDKIYIDSDIPDYDFFSTSPWEDAVELADIFYKKGYKYVEAKAGIHKGTYKVFVNMWPVADISFMPKKEFDKIKTKIINGLPVVSPYKLMESMYKEFSEPYGNPSRWAKVAIREKILRKSVKPFKKLKCTKGLFLSNKPELSSIQKKIKDFLNKKEVIFSGDVAYNSFVEIGEGKRYIKFSHISVLAEDAKALIEELFSFLATKENIKQLEIVTSYSASKELNNTFYKLYMDNSCICEITHLTSCTPYIKIGHKKVVSIDYLKYELFDVIVFADTKQESVDAKCKIKNIERIQENYYKNKGITEMLSSPFERFISNCKGPFKDNIKVTILKRWEDRVRDKEKVITEWTPLYKVKKYPRKLPNELDEKCPKNKENCAYPCTWNKKLDKCLPVPTGTYRAGEDNLELENLYAEE